MRHVESFTPPLDVRLHTATGFAVGNEQEEIWEICWRRKFKDYKKPS